MRRFLLLLIVPVLFVETVSAEKLIEIKSNPPGVRIEANGQFLGTTPFEWKVDDFVTNPTKRFAWSKHLNVPITLVLSKEGYVTKSQVITTDPMTWRDLYRRPGYVLLRD